MDAKLDSGSKPEYFRPKYKDLDILQTHHDKPSQIGRFVPDFTGARVWNKQSEFMEHSRYTTALECFTNLVNSRSKLVASPHDLINKINKISRLSTTKLLV